MKSRLLVASAALLVVSIAGCNRHPATPTVPAASATPAPEAVNVATQPEQVDMANAGVEPNAAGFAGKDIAGSFKGSLPCADCPGIDESLDLKPDGSFSLTDAYRDRPQGTRTIAGSWTLEANGTRIHLDPNTKGEQDRFFAMASRDRLDVAGADGKAIAGAPAASLARTP